MSITRIEQQDDLLVLQVKNHCHIADVRQAQALLSAMVEQAGSVRALILVEEFAGWDPSENWSELALFGEQGDDARAIAVVADPRWKDEAMLFLLAGLRQAEVAFFSDESAARSWLAQFA